MGPPPCESNIHRPVLRRRDQQLCRVDQSAGRNWGTEVPLRSPVVITPPTPPEGLPSAWIQVISTLRTPGAPPEVGYDCTLNRGRLFLGVGCTVPATEAASCEEIEGHDFSGEGLGDLLCAQRSLQRRNDRDKQLDAVILANCGNKRCGKLAAAIGMRPLWTGGSRGQQEREARNIHLQDWNLGWAPTGHHRVIHPGCVSTTSTVAVNSTTARV
ncbi:hypothetical protein N657DRAFT_26933 [Parathielavia appendiculata]|uniref:Uncharacterized protein n=1 Tax=Parathielavia appendiculata TaxID=2587402 RepID=A0AAN6U8Q6_9PEZI|nr:hypothetical protein N657DRAFT_26933 [Parathielavia appendiculata]